MELFLCYVIGLTLVSFVSIILTETPVPVLPQVNHDLEFHPVQARAQIPELSQRIDLVGKKTYEKKDSHGVSDQGSIAELSASPAGMHAV